MAQAHRAQLRRLLDAAAPRECCGVLIGVVMDGVFTVRGVLPMLNATLSNGEFCVPDAEVRRAEWLTAQAGEQIVALYHSHPGGSTELSEPDRDSLAHSAWPWLVITEATESEDVAFQLFQVGPGEPKARASDFHHSGIALP